MQICAYMQKRESMNFLLSKDTKDCCITKNRKSKSMLPQDQVVKIYNRIAYFYDAWAYLTESRARKRALELADIHNGQRVLEVAVGTGLAFYEIVKLNSEGVNVGIDISAGMLKKASLRLAALSGDNFVLKHGDALNIGEPPESFDLLLNSYMFDLMSAEDMDRVLKQFRGVLKPGGKLVLVNMTKGRTLVSRIYDRLYQLSPRLMGGCRGVQLSNKLAAHGFRVVHREYWQQLLFPSEVILAYK